METRRSKMAKGQHMISLYVSNRAGVLARITLIFTKRGFNIDSLVVSHGQDPHFSWMNIEVSGNAESFDLMIKQLNKLVDVIQVKGYSSDSVDHNKIERELAMIKIVCQAGQRDEVLATLNAFRGTVIDVSPETLTFQVTGTSDKVDASIEILAPYGILEIVRSGKILIERGEAKEPIPLNASSLEEANESKDVADWEQKVIQE